MKKNNNKLLLNNSKEKKIVKISKNNTTMTYNTNSNTNDEDKASTEFPNELDKRKSKSIFQNDSIEGDVFTKIINGDLNITKKEKAPLI